MGKYQVPTVSKPPKLGGKKVQLIANGDLRLSANQNCWSEQQKMEQALGDAVAAAGCASTSTSRRTNMALSDRKEKGWMYFAGSTPRRR